MCLFTHRVQISLSSKALAHFGILIKINIFLQKDKSIGKEFNLLGQTHAGQSCLGYFLELGAELISSCLYYFLITGLDEVHTLSCVTKLLVILRACLGHRPDP